MSGIEGVIFDLGNTLMYLDNGWEVVRRRGVRDLANFLLKQGLVIDPSEFAEGYLSLRSTLYAKAVEDQVERTTEDSLKTFLTESGYPDVASDLIEEAVRVFFAFEEEQWTPYPQAETTLRQLSERGYRLALISNATDDRLIQGLSERSGFSKWFDISLTSAGVGLRKPHPGIFEKVLNQWSFPPSRVVMIGDTLRFDVLGAHRSGLKGILAAWDLYPDYDAGADNVVPDATVESLPQVIEAIAAFEQQPSPGPG